MEVVSAKNTPAQFIYFGIKKNLEIEFKRGVSSILKETTIQLVCNVDGLSIFNSSVWQFWPLLVQIFVKNCRTEPFVIALYYGDSKPADLETYFQEFIEETNVLQKSGFTYGETNFKFRLKYFICDSPARAFLKGVKSHNNSYIILRCMKVMKIIEIVCNNDNSVSLSGSVYQKNVNAFEHPIPSSLVHIFKVDGLSAFQFTVTLQDVFTKCLLFSVEDDIFAVGLLYILRYSQKRKSLEIDSTDDSGDEGNSWDVIIFTKDNSVDFVPSCWAIDNNKTSYVWPALKTESKLLELKRKCRALPPHISFTEYQAIFKRTVTSITEAKDCVSYYVDNMSSCSESNKSTTSITLTPLEPQTVTVNVSDNCRQSHLPTSSPIDFDGTDGNSFSLVEEDMSIEFDKTLINTMSPNADDIRKEFGSFATGKIPLTADCFNDFVEKLAYIMEKQAKILGGIHYELRGLREQFSSSNVAIAKCNISQEDVEIASIFPIQSEEKLQDVEVKLQHNEFFQKVLASVSLVGGKDINNLISNVLRKTLSKELSLGFSGVGRKGKKNFSNLQLYKVILAAVKIRYSDVDDIAVLKRTSLVLATSGDRDGGRKARSTKRFGTSSPSSSSGDSTTLSPLVEDKRVL